MAKVIKFTQENCRPCGQLEIFMQMQGIEGVEEVMITSENKDEVLDKYDIMSTPTCIAFDEDGNELERFSGANFAQADEFFSKYL